MKSAKARTFVESLKKQSCLFGTLHIKAAAAIITFIDLFFICHFDEVLYKNRASDLQYNISFALILYMLVMVLLAQYALHRNAGWMLLPLIITHIGFCLVSSIVMHYCEPMNVNNEVFENVKDVGEIVFFEKPSITRRHHLVASPAPYDSPRGAPTRSPTRSVLFTNVL
uniref:Uncharacterized protein n=1 Tax=Panagrolaimus davidi TaxID=227884 RepID=A0A914QGD0_9BILA